MMTIFIYSFIGVLFVHILFRLYDFLYGKIKNPISPNNLIELKQAELKRKLTWKERKAVNAAIKRINELFLYDENTKILSKNIVIRLKFCNQKIVNSIMKELQNVGWESKLFYFHFSNIVTIEGRHSYFSIEGIIYPRTT